MRAALLVVAACGLVVVAVSTSAADDATSFGNSASPVTNTPAVAGASRSPAEDPFAAEAQPATSTHRSFFSTLNEVPATNPKKMVPASSSVASSKKDGNLIHAEYRQDDFSQRKHIEQVSAKSSDGKFDDGVEQAAHYETVSTADAKNASHIIRVGAIKGPASLSALTAAGLSDPSETPAVTAQWVKKSIITVGQECSCDLVVKNTGRAAARDLTIEGYFPSTVRLTNADPMPTDNQDHVTWSFASLGAGEERTIHVKLIPSKRGELPTTALVHFTHASRNVFVVEEPMLGLAMHGPKDLMIGDPATQSITVSNPGTGVASNVSIEAHVTKGLEHPRGERLLIQVGLLNPGESRVVRLPLVAVAGGEQTIAVRAVAANDLRQELVGKISVVAPSLKVTLDGPSLRYVGRKAAYVATVTNDGGAPLTNVRVTHKLPEGFRFARADKGGGYDDANRMISWTIAHLDVKESTQLKFDLATTQIGTHVETVSAVSEQGARSEAKLETVVDGTASLEVEIIDLNDPVEVGTETAYEIHVRNDGSKAAANVAITCEIPAGVEMLRAEGATPGRGEQGILTFRPLSLLDPGKAAIYRVYVKGRKEGNHRFRVRLSSDSIKEPLIYEEMTKFYAE